MGAEHGRVAPRTGVAVVRLDQGFRRCATGQTSSTGSDDPYGPIPIEPIASALSRRQDLPRTTVRE